MRCTSHASCESTFDEVTDLDATHSCAPFVADLSLQLLAVAHWLAERRCQAKRCLHPSSRCTMFGCWPSCGITNLLGLLPMGEQQVNQDGIKFAAAFANDMTTDLRL